MKRVVIFLLISIFLSLSFVSFAEPPTSSSVLTLFYSNSCPHCKDVLTFIDENNLNTKLSLVEKEISDKKNNDDLVAAVQDCKLKTSTIALPLLFEAASHKCFIGENETMSRLKGVKDAKQN